MPVAIRVAVLPVTVQTAGVEDEKVTGIPELAVALRASVPVLNNWAGITANVTVWASWCTVKVCDTAAAAYAPLPACTALMVQLPELTMLAVAPETVQIAVVEEA